MHMHMRTDARTVAHLCPWQRVSGGRERHIPEIGYRVFASHAQEPSLSEGFVEIKKVNFVPQFDDPEHERLFYQFT